MFNTFTETNKKGKIKVNNEKTLFLKRKTFHLVEKIFKIPYKKGYSNMKSIFFFAKVCLLPCLLWSKDEFLLDDNNQDFVISCTSFFYHFMWVLIINNIILILELEGTVECVKIAKLKVRSTCRKGFASYSTFNLRSFTKSNCGSLKLLFVI